MANQDITDFDGADIIDVRDVIARVEELREHRYNADEEDESKVGTSASNLSDDEAEELEKLEELLSELCGYGGDERWEGDWYPVTLIKDSYFEEYMDDMLEDCGDLPKNIPAYLKIVVDYDMLKQDYSEVDFEGNTYYYR
jgi:hypothetical protein